MLISNLLLDITVRFELWSQHIKNYYKLLKAILLSNPAVDYCSVSIFLGYLLVKS